MINLCTKFKVPVCSHYKDMNGGAKRKNWGSLGQLGVTQYVLLSCHLGWMNRRRFCLQKGGSQEHICLITIMFCFNEFAFTVQVIHKINCIQILVFILICLYFTTGHFHTCTLRRM